MTIERTDGPTPGGGAYTIAAWVTRETMADADKQIADAVIISEYLSDGTFIRETILAWVPKADAAPVETPEETFKRLGFEWDQSEETSVIFLGPRGAAAVKKLLDKK